MTWTCSLCFLSRWCSVGGNFACSVYPECTSTRTSNPSGGCSESNDLISCQSPPGVTDGFSWPFFVCVYVPGINNVVFPESECVNGSGMTWKLSIGNCLSFQEMFAISFGYKLPNFKGHFLGAVLVKVTGERLFLS